MPSSLAFLSREQVRDVDRRAIDRFGVSSLVLMENAGRGAAELLIALGVHGPVLICCGKGNNGGDGLVIARHLHLRGVLAHVLLLAQPDQLSADAQANWTIAERAGLALEILVDATEARIEEHLERSEWVVDALFGTGLRGPVQAPLDRAIGAINAGPSRIFAVDIPSGLDADTGEPLGPTIRARHTVTFVAPKKGFANPAASTWVGRVHVVDIGAPGILLEEMMAANLQQE